MSTQPGQRTCVQLGFALKLLQYVGASPIRRRRCGRGAVRPSREPRATSARAAERDHARAPSSRRRAAASECVCARSGP